MTKQAPLTSKRALSTAAIRMPRVEYGEIKREAEHRNMSINSFLYMALQKGVETLNKPEESATRLQEHMKQIEEDWSKGYKAATFDGNRLFEEARAEHEEEIAARGKLIGEMIAVIENPRFVHPTSFGGVDKLLRRARSMVK